MRKSFNAVELGELRKFVPSPAELTYNTSNGHYEIHLPRKSDGGLTVYRSVKRDQMVKWKNVGRVLDYVCRRTMLENGYPVKMKRSIKISDLN